MTFSPLIANSCRSLPSRHTEATMRILGVDGGGSKTQAILLNEQGAIIGRGMAGQSNYHNVGLDSAIAAVADAAQQALQGVKADAAVYCLSACDSALDEQRL